MLLRADAMMDALLATDRPFAGRYRVGTRLATGGAGSVYEAVHEVTGRRCALKVLRPHLAGDRVFRESFLRESRVTAQIACENIVDVLDAGIDTDTNRPFIVMELLAGEDLSQRVRRKGRFTAEEAAVYLAQTAIALDISHGQTIVHRDLKPANLFLTRQADGGPLIKILDFGIAKVLAAQSTQGAGGGTPMYMAPEQFRGQPITPTVDIYALGMIAFRFLVGHHYFELEGSQITNPLDLTVVLAAGPREPASYRAQRYLFPLPPTFDAWFARACHPDPAQRFARASEATIALCEALAVAIPEELRPAAPSRKIGALTHVVRPGENPVLARMAAEGAGRAPAPSVDTAIPVSGRQRGALHAPGRALVWIAVLLGLMGAVGVAAWLLLARRAAPVAASLERMEVPSIPTLPTASAVPSEHPAAAAAPSASGAAPVEESLPSAPVERAPHKSDPAEHAPRPPEPAAKPKPAAPGETPEDLYSQH
ncbi:MAG: serine/threonine-protein kinase [Polyangiaceae bacterium]